MNTTRKILAIVLTSVMVYACKKSYNPTVIAAANNYLVVDGVINAGADSTIINISRTVNLDSKVTTGGESGATVVVEGSDNSSYPLTAGLNGMYANPGLKLNTANKYRLNIITKDGKKYLSDFVAVQITPPIDSITFKPVNNRLQIYANSHDDSNNTRRYRFSYEETWEFTSMFLTAYESNGVMLVPRKDRNSVYYCWNSHKSNSIVVGSTLNLSQDKLSQFPVTYIDATNEKIESRYSILLHEYALSKDAYDFWTNLSKNTEHLGSIFDAQPSLPVGNIHCVGNPTEPVVGYISASTVTSKRIFITKSQLPPDWYKLYPYKCTADSLLFGKGANVDLITLPNPTVVIDKISNNGTQAGWLITSPECAICTLRGTNKKPSYWP